MAARSAAVSSEDRTRRNAFEVTWRIASIERIWTQIIVGSKAWFRLVTTEERISADRDERGFDDRPNIPLEFPRKISGDERPRYCRCRMHAGSIEGKRRASWL